MKYIVIVGDGMADRPLKELNGRTPLAAAFTPNMDKLARESTIGVVRLIPKGMHPGSDVANLSIMGYDPRLYYTGRAPLEAVSMGIALKNTDVAYRCNLVTLTYNKDKTIAYMEDHSAGHITSEEAAILIKDLNDALGNRTFSFYPGVSYRNLMIWSGGSLKTDCTPPHDILGKEITDYLPMGEGEKTLRELMLRSIEVLENHPVNKKRIEAGLRPANSIWLWGQGKRPSLPTLGEKYGIKGVIVSAVDLTKGLGICAGLEVLKVPGVTGYLDTNYVGKAEYSLKALETVDFAYIHVEAPDEAGHAGSYKDKIKAIEDFDALVVGTILRGIRHLGEHRILLLPDHATPIEIRTHTEEPVPFVLYDSRQKKFNKDATFDESIAQRPEKLVIEDGHKLMDLFIKEEI